MILDIDFQIEIWKKAKPDTYKIAVVVVGYSAIANQLIQYIEDLNTYPSIDCIGLIINDEKDYHKNWLEKHYPEIPFLSVWDDECEKIGWLDVIIIPESNQLIYECVPSTIIKIGLPHGTDVLIESTLCTYGGGFCFDYILGAKRQPKLARHKYVNSFPALMRLHQLPFVSELPFGFPKLDRFFNTVSNFTRPKKSIVYHISLLSIEEDWVVESLFETLKILLDEFPKYRIIFRVHHNNRKHPNVGKCIDLGRKYLNFYYSNADSYIEDYATGAVMVTHREYSNHLFDLATGCPTVVYKLDPSYSLRYEHDDRYYLADKAHFVEVLNQALNTQFDTSIEGRKQRCLSMGIYNPGASIDYLVDNLKYIVRGEVLPQWTTYYLNAGNSKDIAFKLRQLIASNRPFGAFAMAYVAMTKNSAFSLLLLAESFIRNTTLKEYYYPLAFNTFYQLVHREDFASISAASRYWWEARGKTAFSACLKAIEKGEISETPQLQWLAKYYPVPHETTEDLTGFVSDPLTVFSLHDGVNIKAEDVIFYGAGDFTEQMILTNEVQSQYHPIAIFDADETKQGTFLRGIPVLSPDKLSRYPQNIIIGSQGSLVEIINSLLVIRKVKNKLHGFVNDPTNKLLLRFLNKT